MPRDAPVTTATWPARTPFEFTVAEFAQLMKVSRQRVYRVIEDVTDELQSQIARLPLRDFEYEQALLEEKRLAAEEGRNPKPIPRPDVDPRRR